MCKVFCLFKGSEKTYMRLFETRLKSFQRMFSAQICSIPDGPYQVSEIRGTCRVQKGFAKMKIFSFHPGPAVLSFDPCQKTEKAGGGMNRRRLQEKGAGIIRSRLCIQQDH